MKFPASRYAKSLLLAAAALAPLSFVSQAHAVDLVLWNANDFADTAFYKETTNGLNLVHEFTPGITARWVFPNNATRQFVTQPGGARVLRFAGASNGNGISFGDTITRGTVTVDFSLAVSTNQASFDLQLLAPGSSMTDASLFGPQVRWQRMGADAANNTVSAVYYDGTDFQVITGATGLSLNQEYDYRIVAHLTGSSAGTFDFWLNGTELATGLVFRNSNVAELGINAVGFRYLRNETADLYNIRVTATNQIPEAGHISLIIGAAALVWIASRRCRR